MTMTEYDKSQKRTHFFHCDTDTVWLMISESANRIKIKTGILINKKCNHRIKPKHINNINNTIWNNATQTNEEKEVKTNLLL